MLRVEQRSAERHSRVPGNGWKRVTVWIVWLNREVAGGKKCAWVTDLMKI